MTIFSNCDNCCDDCKDWLRCFSFCRCVPQKICVTMEVSNTSSSSASLSSGAGCDCDTVTMMLEASVTTDRVSWSGDFVCNDLSVDLAIVIEKGLGFIFLESECLGLTGSQRPSKGIEIGQCLRKQDLPIVFDVSGADGCGYDTACDNLTVTVSHIEFVVNPLDCDCGCFCRDLCLTFKRGDPNVEFCHRKTIATFDSDTKSWTATFECPDITVNIELFLEVDEYGDCQIRLAVEQQTFDDNIRTDSVICIDSPTNLREFTFQLQETSIDPEGITVECLYCDDCVIEPCPICPDPLPETIYLTLEVVEYTDCDCVNEITDDIPFTFDNSTGLWSSESPIEWPCYPGGQLTIELYCDDRNGTDELFMSTRFENSDCTIFVEDEAGTINSCDPFEVEWFLGELVPACCEGDNEPTSGLTITGIE